MSDDISVLGIAVEQRGVKEGTAALDKLAAAGKKAEQSTDGLTGASKKATFEISSLAKAAASAGLAFGAVNGIKGIAAAMIEAQQSAQKLRNSLEYSAGGAKGAAKEIAYLRDVTGRLGLDFTSASAAYAKFAAATKDTGVSAAQTKTVFEGIAAASAKLGLSADETNGALLALSQMASKGTVSAEELRGQLGERLPGAFKIAADAMGVTQKELGKMMEQGQLLASDFLPRLGEALKQHFEAPLGSITQEINRLNSAWDLWKQELSEGTNGDAFRWLTDGLKESEAAMRRLGNEAGIVHKLLVAIGGFEAGALGVNKFDTSAVQQKAMQELAVIKARVAVLREEKEVAANGAPTGTKNRIDFQLNAALGEEVKLREKLMTLAVQRGKETGINLPDLKGEYEAQQKKKTDSLNAYLGDMTNAPRAVEVAAKVEKENKAFKAAVSGFDESSKQYQDALKAHNERIAEITKDPKGARAENGIANATLSFDLERIKRESEQLAEIYAGSERIMEANHAAGLISDQEYYQSKAAFIKLEADAQESALQQQIERLSQESLAGKDRIENEKKILEAKEQIKKIQLEAGFAVSINSIQETSAINKIAQAYESARASAQAYLDAVKLQSAREISGYGMGSEYRSEQGAQNRIEDKFLSRRSSLDDQKRANQITQKDYDEYLAIAKETYDEEVKIHAATREEILGKQEDWAVGAAEALANYLEDSRNVAKRTEEYFSNAYRSIEQSMSDFLFDPFDKGVKGMLQGFGEAIRRMIADAVAADLAKRLFGAVGNGNDGGWMSAILGMFGSSTASGTGAGFAAIGSLFGPGRASGGAVSAGKIYPVNEQGPELLSVGSRQYLMMGNQSGTVTPSANNNQSTGHTIIVNVSGTSAPDVRRAAGQGAREALAAINGAGRYR